MNIQAVVVICVTVLGGVMSICAAIVLAAHRRRARSWARSFQEGVGIRILGALAVVIALIYLAAAELLTDPLLALLSALAGFILGGALPARPMPPKERRRKQKRPRRPPRKGP